MNQEEYAEFNNVDLLCEIAQVLEPERKWEHIFEWTSPKWICKKCHTHYCSGNPLYEKPCPVPDAAVGSWADLADQLVEVLSNKVGIKVVAYLEQCVDLCEFIFTDARTRCCILLVAIKDK